MQGGPGSLPLHVLLVFPLLSLYSQEVSSSDCPTTEPHAPPLLYGPRACALACAFQVEALPFLVQSDCQGVRMFGQ